MPPARKFLNKRPRVAILLESSHEASRGRLRGILKYVRLHGQWGLHLVPGGAGDQRLPALKQWGATGIIGRIPSEKVALAVVAATLPTVLFDPMDRFLRPRHPLSEYGRVCCDNPEIGVLAAEYLLKQGFIRFAVVPETTGTNWSRQRCDAFIETVRQAGREVSVYSEPKHDPKGGAKKGEPDWGLECRRMIRWLKRLPKPIGIFTPHDIRGRQVLDACSIAEIKVPHQVAVLGVDNDELICETTTPPMSSVAVDTESAGYAAAEMLDALMRKTRNVQREFIYKPLGVVPRTSAERLTPDDPVVLEGREFIEINSGFSIRVSDVVRHLKLSKRNVELRFRKILGRSVMEEIQRVRLESVRRLVAQTDRPFQEIATLCGFGGASYLAALFREEFGVTMSAYRDRHTGTASE